MCLGCVIVRINSFDALKMCSRCAELAATRITWDPVVSAEKITVASSPADEDD